MTLADWETENDLQTYEHPKGERWIPDILGIATLDVRSDLWHLSDYLVSSVTGGTIWLIKRASPNQDKENV